MCNGGKRDTEGSVLSLYENTYLRATGDYLSVKSVSGNSIR
jgi:hypothetical protein